MTIPATVTSGRANAERTLTEPWRIVRRTEGTYAPGAGLVATDAPIWDGLASLTGPTGSGLGSNRTQAGGDDQTLPSHTLIIPAAVEGVVVGDIAIGHAREMVVKAIARRTHGVLQRLTVVDRDDAEGVPR